MEKLKKIIRRALYPGTAVVLISIPVGIGSLCYSFLIAGEDTLVVYISYLVSAYALAIVCLGIAPVVRKVSRSLHELPYVGKYLDDIPFKTNLSVHLSLGVNLLYVALNAFSGVRYRSVWFGTLAMYYIFLSVMRFLLARYSQKRGLGEDRKCELSRYRMCGIILLMMNIALIGVVILVISDNKGFRYSGMMIYVVALYTFYITVMAIINMVKYRKINSPVAYAVRVINMAAALVSMLALETAMLTQFDDGSTSSHFRQIMTGVSGCVACAMIAGLGIHMIIRSSRELKRGEYAQKGTDDQTSRQRGGKE